MAKDLGFTDVSKLEQRVEELLLSGCLKDCRIDSRSLTLSRPSANENSTVSSIAETHKQLHQLGQYLSDDGFAVMVHLECLQQGLVVADSKHKDRPSGEGRSHNSYDDTTCSDSDTAVVDNCGASHTTGTTCWDVKILM